ncbi:MAG: sulfatase [Chloroflexota bacterium]
MKSRPNIILIFADDLGYGDLGCYGSQRNRTPHLNQMAAEGMRFTDFYVAAPVCSPSRAALMTGCYPRRVGLEGGDDFVVLLPGDSIGLHPDETTIPSLLKSAGYCTKMIGKWHLGDQPDFLPTRHGFDSYFGLPYSNDMAPDLGRTLGTEQRFMPPLPLLEDEAIVERDPNQAWLTDRYTAEAIRFLEANAQQEAPFFLYLAHMYVHTPIYAPQKYLRASDNGVYGAAVEHMDAVTGALLDTLKRLNIDDNTLVIFTSDNGSGDRKAGSNQPLRGFKGQTWEGGMREPCIMRWPKGIKAGSTCSELVTVMDLLPTFARLVGEDLPTDRIIDGQDIHPLLQGQPESHTPYDAFFYYGRTETSSAQPTEVGTLQAVRSGRWKLHLLRDELYDLDADIGEQNNIIADHPAVVTRLRALADSCRLDLGDSHTGLTGNRCRPVGRVDNPKPLTTFDEMDPHIRALYDLDDVRT